MTEAPEKIYLQDGGDFDAAHDVTWCEGTTDKNDTKYIRADLVPAWSTDMDAAPCYDFDDDGCEYYLVRLKYDHGDCIEVVVGAFLEDGFYLSTGEEIGRNWTPIEWRHIDLPNDPA